MDAGKRQSRHFNLSEPFPLRWSKRVFSAEPQVDDFTGRGISVGGGQPSIPSDPAIACPQVFSGYGKL